MTLRIATLCLGLALAPGCLLLDVTPAPERVVPSRQARPGAQLSRVVVTPLMLEDAERNDERLIRRRLSEAITRQSLFEILPVSARDLEDLHLDAARQRGVFQTDDLLALNHRFGADGVLSGTLVRFRAYPHAQIALRLQLVDCRNGQLRWSTDVVFDASDPRVARDAHNYYDLHYADPTNSLVEHEKVLVSPRLFSAYASQRLAEALDASMSPPVRRPSTQATNDTQVVSVKSLKVTPAAK